MTNLNDFSFYETISTRNNSGNTRPQLATLNLNWKKKV